MFTPEQIANASEFSYRYACETMGFVPTDAEVADARIGGLAMIFGDDPDRWPKANRSAA